MNKKRFTFVPLSSSSLAVPALSSVCRSKHTLPDLPYDYNALEPIISADIMQLHHSKHHAAYVNNLNVAEEKLAEAAAKGCPKTQISLMPAIKFNGGGHINHSIFWKNLTPYKNRGEPSGDLLNAIKTAFGSVDAMKSAVSAAAVGVQGSGWAWLAYNPRSKLLEVAACPNQDPLEATTGLHPLFGIDVWEHAYYLQYKNARPDYVKAIWEIANWQDISERLAHAKKG